MDICDQSKTGEAIIFVTFCVSSLELETFVSML